MNNNKEFKRVQNIVSNYRKQNNLPEPTEDEIKEIILLLTNENQ